MSNPVIVGYGKPCRNCGARPSISKQRGYYPFVLRHPSYTTCPAEFSLEAHHKSIEACKTAWDEFNARPARRGGAA